MAKVSFEGVRTREGRSPSRIGTIDPENFVNAGISNPYLIFFLLRTSFWVE